ncbi:MAG: cell division protein FtsW [Patiriisocius sp.]|jgi:cell division protein FtsW
MKLQAFVNKLKGDRPIWVLVCVLSLISLLAVYSSISSLAYKYHDGNTFHFLLKHGLMLVTGFGIMIMVHRVNHKYFYKLSQIAVWLAALLLVITLFFGTSINGASRWMTIPIINQNFQTSDFAKIALITYLARMLSLKHDKIRNFKEGVLPMVIPIAVICALILPANFSTAALLFISSMVVMMVAGVRLVHILGIIGMAVAGFALLIMINTVNPEIMTRAATWKSRTISFFSEKPAGEEAKNIRENYQVEMAKIAIWNGGTLPNLPGSGTSRNYMPHPYSDMIYAFIIEEYGSILGGLGLLLAYLILFFRTVKISAKSDKNFPAFLVIGLGFMITFQAMINMAVAVNLIPVTGQPLPLVSMGGTSIWFTCLALGIILSVSRSLEASGGNKAVGFA